MSGLWGRYPECAHLREHAADGPDVALVVVRLVVREFGTHIVRCPHLNRYRRQVKWAREHQFPGLEQ